MKRVFFALCLLVLCCCFVGFRAGAQTQFAFKVSFTDKMGTAGDIGKPEDFLSARTLARRARLGIGIDSADLPVPEMFIDSALKVARGKLHTVSRWQNNIVTLTQDTSDFAALRACSFVKSVKMVAQYSSPLHLLEKQTSDKSLKKTSGANMRTTSGVGYYGDAYDQIHLANGETLHDAGFRGAGMLIAVIDAGFYQVNSLPGYDSLRMLGHLKDKFNMVMRHDSVDGYSSHGTQVLSTMAGILTGKYVGTAPDADYALYVTEDNGSEQPVEMDNLVAALERADSIGADVATISLGYNSFDVAGRDRSLSLSDIDGFSTPCAAAANTATRKGMLVVASAGNDGGTSWNKILTPGDADSALTCGSTDIDKNVVPSSGRGPNASGRLKPDVCMKGAPGMVFNASGTVSAVGGTSIATPQLAGLAACLWSSDLTISVSKLKDVIRKSAHLASKPDSMSGYGVPDFGKAKASIGPKVTPSTFFVAPNPFGDVLHVSLSQASSGGMAWRLLNSMGSVVGQGKEQSTSLQIDLNVPQDLPAGLYILQLSTDQSVKAVKLQRMPQ